MKIYKNDWNPIEEAIVTPSFWGSPQITLRFRHPLSYLDGIYWSDIIQIADGDTEILLHRPDGNKLVLTLHDLPRNKEEFEKVLQGQQYKIEV